MLEVLLDAEVELGRQPRVVGEDLHPGNLRARELVALVHVGHKLHHLRGEIGEPRHAHQLPQH